MAAPLAEKERGVLFHFKSIAQKMKADTDGKCKTDSSFNPPHCFQNEKNYWQAIKCLVS